MKDKLASLKSAIEANDADKMKSQTEELEKLFAAAYQAAAQAGATASASQGEPAPESSSTSTASSSSEDKGKVVDADFEVVDKDK